MRALALLPHGAIALRVDNASDYDGNVAAFMPIGMAWGQPIVVHGCFALDDARKQIQLPDGKKRMNEGNSAWNLALLNGPCAQGYVQIIRECCRLVSDGEMELPELFRFFELPDEQSNAASSPLRRALCVAMWKKLLTAPHAVFPVASPKELVEMTERYPTPGKFQSSSEEVLYVS